MKLRAKLALALLLIAVPATSAACGGSGDTGSGEDMRGMDGGKTGMQTEETTTVGTSGKETSGGMGSMGGMSGMDSGSMKGTSSMLMDNGKYSDRRFIDAMVPHHRGAVQMARAALANGEHREIRDLAGEIISTQRSEIRELESIKQQEYGTSKTPMEMSQRNMGMMSMTDPQKLAKQRPFDEAFIGAMIPHHQSAIEMAQVARRESGNKEIRTLAAGIVEAQKREISEMQQWRGEWYPEG